MDKLTFNTKYSLYIDSGYLENFPEGCDCVTITFGNLMCDLLSRPNIMIQTNYGYCGIIYIFIHSQDKGRDVQIGVAKRIYRE